MQTVIFHFDIAADAMIDADSDGEADAASSQIIIEVIFLVLRDILCEILHRDHKCKQDMICMEQTQKPINECTDKLTFLGDGVSNHGSSSVVNISKPVSIRHRLKQAALRFQTKTGAAHFAQKKQPKRISVPITLRQTLSAQMQKVLAQWQGQPNLLKDALLEAALIAQLNEKLKAKGFNKYLTASNLVETVWKHGRGNDAADATNNATDETKAEKHHGLDVSIHIHG